MNINKDKITFGWDTSYDCNFRCPYCGVWVKKSDNDLVLSPEEWHKIWKKIKNKYGECHIYVSGGEPSVYPDFLNVIKKLAELHTLEICTNLTFDIDEFLKFADPKRIQVAATYHSTFMEFEDFFSRVRLVKEYLPNGQVYCVGFKDQVGQMPDYKKSFDEIGVTVVPLPLIGDNVQNTQEEKDELSKVSPYKNSDKFEYQFQKESPMGKLCRAGQLYALIRADGSVDRCSRYSDGSVGNILKDDFALFDEPVECKQDKCPLESQWIVQDGEQ